MRNLGEYIVATVQAQASANEEWLGEIKARRFIQGFVEGFVEDAAKGEAAL